MNDWWQQPTIRVVAHIGGWGLYIAVGGAIILKLLEFIGATNKLVLALFWWTARAGAVAWAASWGVIIIWGAVRWLIQREK